MKKICIYVIVIFLTACAGSDKAYTDSVNAYLELTVPRYLGYIEKDSTLEKNEKDAVIKASNDALLLSREKKQK